MATKFNLDITLKTTGKYKSIQIFDNTNDVLDFALSLPFTYGEVILNEVNKISCLNDMFLFKLHHKLLGAIQLKTNNELCLFLYKNKTDFNMYINKVINDQTMKRRLILEVRSL